MPTPSASRTARDLSTRPTLPRWHSTIAPATRRASRLPGAHTRASARLAPPARAPARPAPGGRGAPARVETIAPSSRGPPVTTTRPSAGPAGGAADGGDPRAGVGGVRRGPALPAAAATTMSASAAPSSARSTVSMLGRPAHGQAEHVDAVAAGAVDRGDQVGGRAAVVGGVGGAPAGLVDGDPGLRRHAAVAAQRLAAHPHRDAGVAGRDRGHLGAVAVGVARGEVGRAAQVVLAEAVDEPPGRRRPCRRSRRRPSRRRSGSRRRSRGGSLPSGTAAANSGLSGARPVSMTPTTVPAPPPARAPLRPIAAAARSAPASRRIWFGSTRATSSADSSSSACVSVSADGEPVERGRPAVRRLRGVDAIAAAGPGAAAWRSATDGSGRMPR